MYGPVIRGSNFSLRPPRDDEAETMISWFEDQEVTARLKLRFPPSPAMEREWLQTQAKDPNCVFWAIEHAGHLVGVSHIAAINWQHRHAVTGTLIGDTSAWGKGIAREMMRLRTEYAFQELGLHKLSSAYLEGNVASARAQAAAGYKEIGRSRQHFWRDGGWLDLIHTEVLRDDWEAMR
jgi:RimJ/RimL family protein N-acetyltransferase